MFLPLESFWVIINWILRIAGFCCINCLQILLNFMKNISCFDGNSYGGIMVVFDILSQLHLDTAYCNCWWNRTGYYNELFSNLLKCLVFEVEFIIEFWFWSLICSHPKIRLKGELFLMSLLSLKTSPEHKPQVSVSFCYLNIIPCCVFFRIPRSRIYCSIFCII